jgi:pimeloyl-ACP methyl ester carboxylesterase
MTEHLTTAHVRSGDGARLVVDVVGTGPPLILVGGAFSYRRWKGFTQLAQLLADSFTVHGYDRRGRGDSHPHPPTTVQQEIEDLAAVATQARGPAHIFGMSSGGVLALRAVAAGVPARSLAVYQPPFLVTDHGAHPPPDFAQRLRQLLDENRRGAAVHYFMTRGMGAPAPIVTMMRVAPFWKDLKAVAHTLPADHAVMGETLAGRPLGRLPWADIGPPTLVIDGGKSPRASALAADDLADLLPAGERATLPGQSHNVSMTALAVAIRGFATAVDATHPRGPDPKEACDG